MTSPFVLTGVSSPFVLIGMDWSEGDHPRDQIGQFTSGGGSTTIRAFHGTNVEFDKFEVGPVGGVWFTSERAHAEGFGKVGEYDLKFRSPVRIDGADAHYESGGYEADNKLADVLKRAASEGHDGAIIDNWEGGGTVYVALDPDQITRIDKPIETVKVDKATMVDTLRRIDDDGYDPPMGDPVRKKLEARGFLDDFGELTKRGRAFMRDG